MYLHSYLMLYSSFNLLVTILFILAILGCQLQFEHKTRVAIDSTNTVKYAIGARLCSFIVLFLIFQDHTPACHMSTSKQQGNPSYQLPH